MTSFHLATTYALGGYDVGNLLEVVTLEECDEATWCAVTRDGAGVELSRRTATDAEVQRLTAPVEPSQPSDVGTPTSARTEPSESSVAELRDRLYRQARFLEALLSALTPEQRAAA